MFSVKKPAPRNQPVLNEKIYELAFVHTSDKASRNFSIVDIARQVADAHSLVNTPLCTLMRRLGSDKGAKCHYYTRLYFRLFQPYVGTAKDVFELGIGTRNPTIESNMTFGNFTPMASHRGWREFFPNAQIYGADIDRDILIDEDRIKTLWVDQLDRNAIREMWSKVGEVDIIIDDGLHRVDANYTFFDESFSHLRSGGIYIIEDSRDPRTKEFMKLFPVILKNHDIDEAIVFRNKINNEDLIIFQKK